jgi:hypothetical protein
LLRFQKASYKKEAFFILGLTFGENRGRVATWKINVNATPNLIMVVMALEMEKSIPNFIVNHVIIKKTKNDCSNSPIIGGGLSSNQGG